MFAELVKIVEETRAGILGDLFMGAITYGEHGQLYTPDNICEMMAMMTMSAEDHGGRVLDSCCGSGRMLLAAADINRNNEFYGVDIDLHCVRMTAINLGLRNL
jgi:type I restriction-modification system DNA methylase subunit